MSTAEVFTSHNTSVKLKQHFWSTTFTFSFINSTSLSSSEMCCGCNRPAGGDSASRGCREGLRGGVLDAAAENWVQDAPREDPQRPHAPGALQTGKNIQVNLQGIFYSWGRNKGKEKKPDDCVTRFIFAPSPGILMRMILLLYCILFLQTSATHQTTESVH